MNYLLKLSLFSLFLLISINVQARYLNNDPNATPAESLTTKNCTILINYGSYGAGTDRKLEKKINDIIISNNSKINDIKTGGWGMEGESTTCLIINNQTHAEDLYVQIKRLIPSFSKRAYTSIDMKGKVTHKTQWPMN
jgi:hypothetical protein